MINEQTRIWEYLIQNALGKEDVKHIEVVAQYVGVPPKGTNNDDVRQWMNDMVINDGKQIGTCQNGTFIILNDAEREEAIRFPERNNRADAVGRNGNYVP